MQAKQAGQEAARQAVLQEQQKELVTGLQQEHHVQAAAMDRQAKAAAQQVKQPLIYEQQRKHLKSPCMSASPQQERIIHVLGI